MHTSSDIPPKTSSPLHVEEFREMILNFYKANQRELPWRATKDPYPILVSEIMLQQTGVERVRSLYPRFLQQFPDIPALAASPVRDVIVAWQGLGYNRRAVFLHRCAQSIMKDHGGQVPAEVKKLHNLPGIGPYTARAIAAFAFDIPTSFIETNIRTVFIHCFFPDRHDVTDNELLPFVEATLDRSDPRTWYYALMDYGAMLKRAHPNPGRKSAHYVRQTSFKGSNRELRSRILKLVLEEPGLDEEKLAHVLQTDGEAIGINLRIMEQEGLVRKEGKGYIA